MNAKKLLPAAALMIFNFLFLMSPPQAKAQLCFNPAVNYATGNSGFYATSADLNGDGKADLAVANLNSGTVSIFLNNGTGTFGAANNVNAGCTAESVTFADYDGDGKIDMATLGSNSLITIALGTGGGNFSTTLFSFAVGSGPTSMTSADYNGDGKIDLVFTTAGGIGNYFIRNTTLYVGQPNFNTSTSFPQCGKSYSIITADFNGDGKADLATANYDSSSVSVYLGTGAGSFSAPVSFAVGSGSVFSNGAVSVTSADVNGDSKLDLVVANGGKNIVSVLLGTGTGSFGTATNFTTDWYPYSVTVADFNGDGKADLATANNSSSKTVSVLLGTGTGSFGTAATFTVGGTQPYSIVSADLNGDGKIDLATANNVYGGNNVSVLINCGAAGVADFNMDREISIYPNPTSGKFNVAISQLAYLNMEKLKVYNVYGECIYQHIGTSSNCQIDLSDAPDGIYFMQMKTDQGTANKKIIVQK